MRQLNGTWEPEIPMLTEKPQVGDPRGREYGCGVSGADCLVVVTKRGNARGAKGTGHSSHDRCGQLATSGCFARVVGSVLHSFRETTTPSLVQSFPATFWASVLATGFACSRSNPYTRTSNAFFPFLTTSPRPARFVPL